MQREDIPVRGPKFFKGEEGDMFVCTIDDNNIVGPTEATDNHKRNHSRAWEDYSGEPWVEPDAETEQPKPKAKRKRKAKAKK